MTPLADRWHPAYTSETPWLPSLGERFANSRAMAERRRERIRKETAAGKKKSGKSRRRRRR